MTGNFDLVFLDAWKPDYKKFFEMVFPRVNPGGLFLAHNVINKNNDMLDFLVGDREAPDGAEHHGVAGARGDFDHLQETVGLGLRLK